MAQASGVAPQWWTLNGATMPLTFAPAACPDGPVSYATMLVHEAANSGPDGTVVAYGKQCGDKPAVEVWGAQQHHVDGNRASRLSRHGSQAHGPRRWPQSDLDRRGWALALRRAVGKSSRRQKVESTLRSAMLGMMAVFGLGFDFMFLYQHHQDGWAAVTMPNDVAPESMVVTKNGDAWLVALGKDFVAYSPRP